jgi:hypothetical protein
MTGAVVGVVVEKLNALAVAKVTGDVPQNVNFAIKGEIASLFAKTAGVQLRMAPPNQPRLEPADVAAKVKPSVYLIECGVQ